MKQRTEDKETLEQLAKLEGVLGAVAVSDNGQKSADATEFDLTMDRYCDMPPPDLMDPYLPAKAQIAPLSEYVDDLPRWHSIMAALGGDLTHAQELNLLQRTAELNPAHLRAHLLRTKRKERLSRPAEKTAPRDAPEQGQESVEDVASTPRSLPPYLRAAAGGRVAPFYGVGDGSEVVIRAAPRRASAP